MTKIIKRMKLSLAGVSVASLTAAAGCLLLLWLKQQQRRRHDPGSEEHAMERHLLETQTPAHALGIGVREYNREERRLTLQAPLHLNTNVHGTAFAGSLYSVAVLCSYYLGRTWLMQMQQQRQQQMSYVLVAKAGSIRYLRPVTVPWIVATSILPPQNVLNDFWEQLVDKGKASMDIPGHICLDASDRKEKDGAVIVACEYSMEVCAYRPR